jgi:hypothetical protein
MDMLLPYTAMISIKDGKNYTDKPGFERLLPGDGTVNYLNHYRPGGRPDIAAIPWSRSAARSARVPTMIP